MVQKQLEMPRPKSWRMNLAPDHLLKEDVAEPHLDHRTNMQSQGTGDVGVLKQILLMG